MTIYFVSGMCVNCHVFDGLMLPDGYERHYIEWKIPNGEESLEEYARMQAEQINTDEPFILVGYSLGGLIVQEMNKFISPQLTILISSMKSNEEHPPLFRLAKRTQLPQILPAEMYAATDRTTRLVARLIYSMSAEEIEKYVSYTDPVYMKWAVCRITEWESSNVCKRLYHIHGTKDQIFPSKQIKNAFVIPEGDHMMLMRRADEVGNVFQSILLDSEFSITNRNKLIQ